jgi:hypothetical protein
VHRGHQGRDELFRNDRIRHLLRVMRRTPDAIDTARDGPGTPVDKLSHPSLDKPTPNSS